jgi:Na+-driven multidrug efflux pump
MQTEQAKLTKGPVSSAITSMMVPMIIGLIVIIGNGLVDAYFVGQLGYAQLAAISYAFPVWFILGGIVMGLGVGTSSVVSRLIGSGNHAQVKEVATHSMILGVCVGIAVISIGLITLEDLFGLLGANEETMPYVKDYMEIY